MLGVVNTGRIASGGTPDKQLDMAGLAPGGPGATAMVTATAISGRRPERTGTSTGSGSIDGSGPERDSKETFSDQCTGLTGT